MVKAGAKAPIVKLDITDKGNQDMVRGWLQLPRCHMLHCSIPCGTASRAREIRNGGPPPLRSDAYPEGLPSFTGLDLHKVTQANAIYQFAYSCILLCHQLGVEWSVEQPRRSLFWSTKHWRSVLAHLVPIYVTFDSCMHGGSRAKSTMIATPIPELMALQKQCDGSHSHLAWGRCQFGFATAQEAEYPLQLCRSWARCVANALRRLNRLPLASGRVGHLPMPVPHVLRQPLQADGLTVPVGAKLLRAAPCLLRPVQDGEVKAKQPSECLSTALFSPGVGLGPEPLPAVPRTHFPLGLV